MVIVRLTKLVPQGLTGIGHACEVEYDVDFLTQINNIKSIREDRHPITRKLLRERRIRIAFSDRHNLDGPVAFLNMRRQRGGKLFANSTQSNQSYVDRFGHFVPPGD